VRLRTTTAILVCGALWGGPAAAMPHEAGHPAPTPARTTLDSAVVEVPMQLGSGRPVVQVRVNGHGPYDFILDTGAGSTVIDSALAASLGLGVAGHDSIGDPRNPRAIAIQLMRADSLQLGGMTFGGVPMASFNLRRMLGARYGGVLGLPAFTDLLVSLDYPRGRVRATRGELSPSDPAVVGYESADGMIHVPLHVGGATLSAHLDSGSPGGLMLPRAASSSFTFKEAPTEVGRAGTVGHSATIWRGRLAGEVKVGPLVYTDPEVELSDLLDRWANIGFDMLRDLTVTVDQRHHRVRMERTATGSTALPLRRRVGVRFSSPPSASGGFTYTDGGLPIEMVVPGSLAERAGLQTGDLVLSLNGRDIKEFAPGDLSETLGGHEPLTLRVRRQGQVSEVRIP
jgi:hypothetical protein